MENRRTFLKQMAALGVAVPLMGALTSQRPTLAKQKGSVPGSQAFAGLTSRQLAGQRVIYSYSGLDVPDALLQQIAAGEAAGVIFFTENIDSDEHISGVIRQLQQAQEQSPIPLPLLLMTDQEGGLVRRLPGPPESSAKQIGQAANLTDAANQAGTEAGQTLANVGMNLNLAPVLGVYREAGDFLDQFERSFSSDAATVAAAGRVFIYAQQLAGVAATAKHFPGLGTASADENTDAVPVTLPVSLDTLRSVDEVPYVDAIAVGVDLVMTSWAVYPALDAAHPAGLSSTIVRDELRGRLGFQGVTITDALEAGALSAFGSDPERAVLAAQAGMDLILCSARDVGQGIDVTSGLADALDNGSIDSGDMSAAVQRVFTLRGKLGNSRFFPETGHSVSHGFLSYWNQYGGLPVFGYPITEEFDDPDTGHVTQYFERARFEWHPGEFPERFDVLLGLLGVELAERQGLTGTQPFQRINVESDANCTFFPETGHRLCFGFRDYWNSHGGLAIFGYPISEEFDDPDTGLTVQYFERQRFEYHPENSPEWQVEGGLLGSEIFAAGQ
jgi:beta-N-acetylhexosaminidase